MAGVDPLALPLHRMLNLVYAMLCEGRDAKGVESLNHQLDGVPDWETWGLGSTSTASRTDTMADMPWMQEVDAEAAG